MFTKVWASVFPGIALLITACAKPAISDIKFLNAPVGMTSQVPEIMAGTMLRLQVSGSGVCPGLVINYGDGSLSSSEGQYDLSSPVTISDHSYNAPPTQLTGFKAIRANADGTTCIGQVTKRILVTPETMSIGWALDPNQTDPCSAGPLFLRNLMSNIAFIFDIPAPTPGGTPVGAVKMGGQSYDADGLSDIADASFPFPGFRKYSVIVKTTTSNVTVAPQVIQGGKHFFFRTNQPGSTVSFCYNSDQLTNPGNTGGFVVLVRADASQVVFP